MVLYSCHNSCDMVSVDEQFERADDFSWQTHIISLWKNIGHKDSKFCSYLTWGLDELDT